MIPTALSFLPRRDEHRPEARSGCFLDEITEPGLYVVHQLGVVVRIPRAVPVEQRPHLIEMLGGGRWIVTRLSPDPEMPLAEARRAASRIAFELDF